MNDRKFLQRQASPQADAERSPNFRKLFLWFSALCVAFLLISCHTTRKVETIPIETIHAVKNRDTIYLHDVSYDSVYIDRKHTTDYHLNSLNRSNCLSPDTVVITDVSVEYRYKLKRDTILRTQFIERHDSIPYEVIVTQTKEVRAPPTWYDKLAYAIAIAVLIFLLFRIRSPIFSFIRKLF